jgi:hypothetical protein
MYPLRDGLRFIIRNRMRSKRQLVLGERIKTGSYRIRSRNLNARNKRGFWVFDSRTHSIRLWINRSLAISVRLGGKDCGKFAQAEVRKFQGDQHQLVSFYGGTRRNIRNKDNQCLDIVRDVNNTHVYWFKCHNGPQ